MQNKRCAFLSLESLADFECYDHLLLGPLGELGWSVQEIPWRTAGADWDQFDAVLIRSTWDYQNDAAAFLEVLQSIENSTAVLANSLDLVRWNIHKSYLRDMQNRGIAVVPSVFASSWSEVIDKHLINQINADEFIIKPLISANADNTFRINLCQMDKQHSALESTFKNRECVLQPFMKSIISEGEYSLFFFGAAYSHTILKSPAAGDFRVQEEHGGRLKSVKPDNILFKTATQVLSAVSPSPLYSRIDFVRDEDRFLLMELELIEPSLYFNMDPDSAKKFAHVFDKWFLDQVEK
ncbi:MAG: hypothetical protein H8D46_00855 [FCB group bacterium]|nr:hypothetical protein [FCB group bacterium]